MSDNVRTASQIVTDTIGEVTSTVRNIYGAFSGGGSTSVQQNSDVILTASRAVQSSAGVVSSGVNVASDLIGLGANLSDTFDGDLISQQFTKVGESFSNTAQSYLQSKIKRIKDLNFTAVIWKKSLHITTFRHPKFPASLNSVPT